MDDHLDGVTGVGGWGIGDKYWPMGGGVAVTERFHWVGGI